MSNIRIVIEAGRYDPNNTVEFHPIGHGNSYDLDGLKAHVIDVLAKTVDLMEWNDTLSIIIDVRPAPEPVAVPVAPQRESPFLGG